MLHTVELVEQALALAQQCGFGVRQDWLAGGRSGGCELKGQKWIFLDLGLSPLEQLDVIISALEEVEIPETLAIPGTLSEVIASRKAA